MSTHVAQIAWERDGSSFKDNKYSRVHRWSFDGGAVVRASSSPDVVRVPFSDPAGVDPEEAFVAALSSCHMLWFLGLAAQAGYVVDSYVDAAQGVLGESADGKQCIIRVTLKPAVVFSSGLVPDAARVDRLHHDAHERCFIANSVKTQIEIQASWSCVA
ncbi:MAG: OsmC family protein [Burkholderiales bacterium]|jgi:organic hydroperoxide reductase OsmC/OhrA|nr:OsmC family protein [Burkholderiales bacterium]